MLEYNFTIFKRVILIPLVNQLKIVFLYNYIEQGTGGVMANTSAVREVITKAKEEIIAKQATKIRQYELNQTYLEGRKHEILTEKLDLNLEIDKKVNELTHKSYVKLFDIN